MKSKTVLDSGVGKLSPRKRVRVNAAALFTPPRSPDQKVKVEQDIEDRGNNGPPNWKLFLDKVREMRHLRVAPVDEMGCYEEGPEDLDPKIARFQNLVTLMLSSQTKDEVTSAAMERLRTQLNPTLTPGAVLDTPETTLAALITPVGFFRRKAQYLRKAALLCQDEYDGDIPRKLEDILKIPGVGPKMGYLLLQIAWRENEGIGVDVHVHRLAQMWNWVPTVETPTPEKTRLALQKWLPQDLWVEINPLLVGFGQTWCPSRSTPKKCQECHLNDLCPATKHEN